MKNKAKNIAVMGASGSGKSTAVKSQLAKLAPKRLLVWDLMREYDVGGVTTTRLSEMIDVMGGAGKTGAFRCTFHPSADEHQRARQFALFCSLALSAGNLTIVVEELKFVTSAARAPVPWAAVTMTGRHKGLTVIGTSQRPASIDKDFLGNATIIRTGCLAYPEDIRAVAKAMRLPETELEALKPLDWIEKDLTTGKKVSGRITF